MSTIQTILTRWHSNLDMLDVELLVAHGIAQSREFVLTHPEYEIVPDQFSIIESLLQRRLNHEPLAYILGHREFFGLDFAVTPDTLIPRPETELMVEKILAQTSSSEKIAIIDVGTGSGCIIISLAKELSKKKPKNTSLTFHAVDISSQALIVAQANARAHGLENAINFAPSDLLQNISQTILDTEIDTLIVAANLPYLSKTIYASSAPDVRNFEPKSALLSEDEGLQHYQRLLEQIWTLSEKKSSMSVKLFFEISPEQKDACEILIRNSFPEAFIETIEDLAGKYRLTIADIQAS